MGWPSQAEKMAKKLSTEAPKQPNIRPVSMATSTTTRFSNPIQLFLRFKSEDSSHKTTYGSGWFRSHKPFAVTPVLSLLVLLIITTVGLEISAAQVTGSDFVWTGLSAGSNNWSDGDNWVEGVAPSSSPTTSVLFADPSVQSSSNVDIPASTTEPPFQLGTLRYDTTAGDFTLDGDSITFNDQLSVAGGGRLTIFNGTLQFNTGATIELEDNSTLNTTRLDGGPIDINGNGNLLFSLSTFTTADFVTDTDVTTIFDNCGIGEITIGESPTFNGRVIFRDSIVEFLGSDQTFNNDVEFESGQFARVVSLNASIAGTTTVRSGATANFEFFSVVGGPGDLIVESGGQLGVDATSIINKTVEIEDGGRLFGVGTVDGGLRVRGNLDPGESVGTLTVDGDVELFETTTTCIELSGSMDGEFDLITSSFVDSPTGDLLLDGDLEISFLDGFIPDAADEFSFITGFNVSGTFQNTPLIGGSNLLSLTDGTFGTLVTSEGTFSIEYQTNSVRLFNFQAVPEPAAAIFLGILAIGLVTQRRKTAA